MRQARALAAAVLLALALGTAGCDWVSSLTPFGIDTRDYAAEAQNVNGDWAGTTASGGEVTFQVGSNELFKLKLHHVAPDCTLSFAAADRTAIVVDDGFTVEFNLETQGRFMVTGKFATGSSCVGTYLFEALPAGVCPTSGKGTFTASKKT